METISYKKFIAQLNDKAYREDVPLNGAFELTPLCNPDCKMCYVNIYTQEHCAPESSN